MLLWSCVGAAGCAFHRDIRVNVSPTADHSEKKTIVVLDLEGNVEPRESSVPGAKTFSIGNAGVAVADALSTALMKLPQYELVERQRLKHMLRELGVSSGDLVDPKNLKHMRKLGNIEAIVLGSVMNYGWWHSGTSYGAGVNFNARLVDTWTGKVLWTASVQLDIERAVPGQLLNQVCAELVGELETQMKPSGKPKGL